MEQLLNIRNLEKSYQDKKVIHNITFDVKQGEILCILGPNGAGKSTTINILTGALGYEHGSIMQNDISINKNLVKFKKKLGIVPQDIALYDDLTALQNIHFFASLYGLKGQELKESCDEALAFTGLTDRAKDKVNTFSGGMKRRLNIACAIAHKPGLLIMDEPTVGIDPQSRNHILSSIKKLRKQGMTIIYTTHYMEEVEEISTRIIIMDHGKIIAEGTKDDLKDSIADEKLFSLDAENTENLSEKDFYKIEGVKRVRMKEGHIEIASLKGIENLDRMISLVIEKGSKINNISCQVTSLETVFLKLTGKSLRD